MVRFNLEIPATLFGLLNVYFVTRASILNWFFGVITVSIYIVIFLQAKLYADMMLQFVFLGFQFYGCYQWLYGGVNSAKRSISRASMQIYCAIPGLVFTLFLMIAFVLKNYTDSTTVYLDAFVTAMSLVAQWMLSKKWVESWLLWMTVDIVAINMYLLKGLYLTALLYCVFFSLCVIGYRNWHKKL